MVIEDERGNPQNIVSRTPVIINKTLTNGGSEYSQALPANCKRFTIQARTAADFKLAYVATESGSNYITVKSGSSYSEEFVEKLLNEQITLYMQSATAGLVVEIVCWY